MRIVEIKKSFTAGLRFEAGHRYVMAEDTEGQYRTSFGDSVGMSQPIETIYKPYKGEDLSGKKLMCWRTGGIGDIFFLNPCLRYLKKKYPTCFLRVASGCKQPLENVPEVDELYDMPFDAKYLNDMDYHLMFQGIIESSSDAAKRTHAVDMFFSYFSIDSIQMPAAEKVPKLFFKKEEMDWLKQILNTVGIQESHYVIGIQMETSAPVRNFPKEKMKVIIDVLSSEPNVKVVLIGTEQHLILAQYYKGNNPNVIIATTYSVRQVIIMANRYNLIISPDSFMVQAAGALEKPLVGLYGPFPSDVRMRYFKNAIGFDPSVVCSPCFKHDFRACIKGFPSPCFSLVTIEDVLQAADYFKVKFTGQHFNYVAQMLKTPNLSDVEPYLLSADKGLAFFPRYFKHPNIITVDTSPFTKPDINDLNTQFQRESYPFVIYFNDFQPKYMNLYNSVKGLVRPGGFFIVYRENGHEAMFADLKIDVGKSFNLFITKFDPATKSFIIAGKRDY